ncbi:MAG: BglI family type II restriction endonuclease [Thaumarchaeota archaeon]|nr:BglI family type II restriction endonuclease [Nitrososphaerota archaeon]
MVDAKAEKKNNTTATIQMAQTSTMLVRMIRANHPVDVTGLLGTTIESEGRTLQTVTILAKYVYRDLKPGYGLNKIIVVCIPNGQLQDRYNPDTKHTIWLAGRDAPTLGEDFRVRVNLKRLKRIADWRVREIMCESPARSIP